MRNPPPGTLESVAEEISAISSSSSSRFSAPHRSSVSASEAECQQRCFATASGAFFLAFSGGLAVQVSCCCSATGAFFLAFSGGLAVQVLLLLWDCYTGIVLAFLWVASPTARFAVHC